MLIRILAVDGQHSDMPMVGAYLHCLCIFIRYCETPWKKTKIYWKILEIYWKFIFLSC